MKPVETWIVLANTREVRILANRGPGKGLVPLPNSHWQVDKAELPSDRPGSGHSIAGPFHSAVDEGDIQRHNDMLFAKDVAHKLSDSLNRKKFDRLVVVSGPTMLGLLRAAMDDRLKAVTAEEVAKDLTAQPLDAVHAHLRDIIAL